MNWRVRVVPANWGFSIAGPWSWTMPRHSASKNGNACGGESQFCAAIGREEWAHDERFQSLAGFAEHSAEIVPELEALFAAHDLDHWRRVLDGAGLIWEPVAELPEVVDDPVLREAGAFSVIIHELAGAMEIVGTPFVIRGSDVAVRGPAPDAGQHTRAVFEELGLASERIDELIASGVLK